MAVLPIYYGEDGADTLWCDQAPGFWGPVYDSTALRLD